jgi:hypothetical protein
MPAYDSPARIPPEIFTWANVIVEIKIRSSNSEICFFILLDRTGFTVVPDYEKVNFT